MAASSVCRLCLNLPDFNSDKLYCLDGLWSGDVQMGSMAGWVGLLAGAAGWPASARQHQPGDAARGCQQPLQAEESHPHSGNACQASRKLF